MITTGIILSKNGANSYNVNIPDLVDGNETFNSGADSALKSYTFI